LKLYLDTSAWVKRYLLEEGSLEIDLAFERAAAKSHELVSSSWNIGECLGVFDKRMQKKELSESEFNRILQGFFRETCDLLGRGGFLLSPVSMEILAECWDLILEEHVYQADALQLKTSLAESCNILLAADEAILRAAKKEGIEAISIEKSEDQMKLRELLKD